MGDNPLASVPPLPRPCLGHAQLGDILSLRLAWESPLSCLCLGRGSPSDPPGKSQAAALVSHPVSALPASGLGGGVGLTQTRPDGPRFHCLLFLLSGRPLHCECRTPPPPAPASSHSCPPWGPMTQCLLSPRLPPPACHEAALRRPWRKGKEKEGRG